MSEYLKRLADRQAKGLLHTAAADESSNFTRGLKSSFKNLGTTGLAALGAATGNDGYLTDAQISQAEGRRYQGDTQDFTGIDSIESAGDWFGYQAGNAVGSMVQTLVGGGIGGAVGKQVAKKAGLAALERSMAAGLGEQAAAAAGRKATGRAVLGGSAVGMAAPNYPQLMGENVLAIMDDRGGEATLEDGDVGAAAFTAVFQTGLDILPVISAARKLGLDDVAIDGFKSGVIKHALKSPTKLRQVGRELGTGMVQEGLTEGAQEALKLATLEYLNESKDHWNLEAFESLVNATMAGAAGGLVMGAGPAVAGAVRSDKPWFRAGEQDEALDAAVNPDAVVNPAESSAVADVSPVTTEQGVPDYATEPVDYSDYLGGKESGTAFGGDSSRSQYADYLDSTRVPVDGQDGGDDYLGLLGGTAGTVDGVQQGGRAELPDYQHFMQNAQKTGSQNAPYWQNDDAGMVLSQTDEIAPPDGAMVPYQYEGELMPRNIGDIGGYNDQSVVIDQAAHESAESPMNELPEPTAAQKEAGNYKKGHLNLLGLPLTIENPKGSVRKGVDESGKPWESVMRSHYGYVKGSLGADGDQVDVFLGEGAANPQLPVFVVDQVDPKTGEFDEHKVMVGFADEQAAKAGYLANYAEGWQGIGGMTPMTVDGFKDWVKSKGTKKPVSGLVDKKADDSDLVAPVGVADLVPKKVKLVTVKNVYGDSVLVDENELAGDRTRVKQYTQAGKKKGWIHRENIQGQAGAPVLPEAVQRDELESGGFKVSNKNPKSEQANDKLWRDGWLPVSKRDDGNWAIDPDFGAWVKPPSVKTVGEAKAWSDGVKLNAERNNAFSLDELAGVAKDPVKPAGFTPTHELPTGELVVAHPDDEGVWVDEQGDEWESGEVSVIVPADEEVGSFGLAGRRDSLSDKDISVASMDDLLQAMRDIKASRSSMNMIGRKPVSSDIVKRVDGDRSPSIDEMRKALTSYRDIWKARVESGQAANADYDRRMSALYGGKSREELQLELDKMNHQLGGLHQAATREMNGGSRRTGPAVSAESARSVGQAKMELERYIREQFDEATSLAPKIDKPEVIDGAPKPLMDAVGDQFASGKKAVVLSGADKLAVGKSLAAGGTILVDKPGRLFLQKGLPEAKRIVFTDMAALARLKAAPNKLKAYADKGIELVFVDPDGTADKGLFEVVC